MRHIPPNLKGRISPMCTILWCLRRKELLRWRQREERTFVRLGVPDQGGDVVRIEHGIGEDLWWSKASCTSSAKVSYMPNGRFLPELCNRGCTYLKLIKMRVQ